MTRILQMLMLKWGMFLLWIAKWFMALALNPVLNLLSLAAVIITTLVFVL